MKKIIIYILTLLGINTGIQAQQIELGIGLEKVLEKASQTFGKNNHAYLINIVRNDTVLFQIIHGGMLNEIRTKNNEFNFSFSLSFDNEKEKEQKFKELKVAKNFKYYEFDNIPSYAINFGNNKENALNTVLEVINKVYNYSSKDLFVFEIYDQGKF